MCIYKGQNFAFYIQIYNRETRFYKKNKIYNQYTELFIYHANLGMNCLVSSIQHIIALNSFYNKHKKKTECM